MVLISLKCAGVPGRLTGTPDHGLGRGAEDRAVSEVEMFAPLGQEDPVAASPALFDNRLIDHAHDLLRLGRTRRLTLFLKRGEDSFGFRVEPVFDGREKFLVGGGGRWTRRCR